jgi:hypothetical protein
MCKSEGALSVLFAVASRNILSDLVGDIQHDLGDIVTLKMPNELRDPGGSVWRATDRRIHGACLPAVVDDSSEEELIPQSPVSSQKQRMKVAMI